MKQVFFLVCCVCICGFPVKPLSAVSGDLARPRLVQEVLDGKRDEALASWWGFDPNDSTEFLQKAIHSNVRKLIVDRQASAWLTRPLAGVSDQEIVLEAETELMATKGAFRGKGQCLLTNAPSYVDKAQLDELNLRTQKHLRAVEREE